MTSVSFDSLGLAEPLVRALTAAGHVTPTPIQSQGIPPVLAGRDLLGLAETGSGKTAAFVLPILNRLGGLPPSPRRHPRALILTPTRELAVQIADTVDMYSRHLQLRTAVIFGGVSAHRQIQECRNGIDIVVATPGRLLDLIGQRAVSLHEVEVLVLDEADRMLDMGFIRDVRRIIATVPQRRQSLLFSATMPKEIADLVAGLLHDPVRVDLKPASVAVDRISQQVIHIEVRRKRALLAGLLCAPQLERVIVFTRTKHGANKVARQLTEIGIKADAIHGNKSQNARQDALESFRNGRVRVLVATDIAARGIDVREITHVINYELPKDAESYVHRIGRTARAGLNGAAISFCAPEERGELRDIERLLRHAVPTMDAGPWLQLSANIPAIVSGEVAAAAQPQAPHAPRQNRHRGRPPRRSQRRRAA
ncbi:MAG: DEAD/DEAH box helicase [Alphaproteobacteria bacterium]|nr:DEAD/DEAH box helicase [Alphaproteobacteria bacterium]